MVRPIATRVLVVKAGDLVQVYYYSDDAKWGSWLSPRMVLQSDVDSGVVAVPSSSLHTMLVAIEDVHLAIIDNDLPIQIAELNGFLEMC